MHESIVLISLVAFTFAFAGMVKGVIGMGLPTVAMGMLGLAMAPVQAAALLVLPAFITNVWQLCTGPGVGAIVRRFATMMAGLFVGSLLGVRLLTHGPGDLASAVLGMVLAAYGVFGLSAVKFAVSSLWERRLLPLVGFVTGLLSGATGLALIPAVPFLNSLSLEKDELIQALGLTFTIANLGLAVGLMTGGQYQLSVAGTSLLALVPAVGGMLLGQNIRNRLSPEVFRRWFFAGMLVLGLYMVAQAFSSR
jgi:uncharacterized membrane protein YfcA